MSLVFYSDVTVDFSKSKYIVVNLKQYDNKTRVIRVDCVDNGSRFLLNSKEHSAFIRYKKADGYGGLNKCEITNDGKLNVRVTDQMTACVGTVCADIIIVAMENLDATDNAILDEEGNVIENAPVISSMNFYINVLDTPCEGEEIVSGNDFSVLNDILSKANKDYKYLTDVALVKAKEWMEEADESKQSVDISKEKISTMKDEVAANLLITKEKVDEATKQAELSKQYSDKAIETSDKATENFNKSQEQFGEIQNTIDALNQDTTKLREEMSVTHNETVEVRELNTSVKTSEENVKTIETNVNTRKEEIEADLKSTKDTIEKDLLDTHTAITNDLADIHKQIDDDLADTHSQISEELEAAKKNISDYDEIYKGYVTQAKTYSDNADLKANEAKTNADKTQELLTETQANANTVKEDLTTIKGWKAELDKDRTDTKEKLSQATTVLNDSNEIHEKIKTIEQNVISYNKTYNDYLIEIQAKAGNVSDDLGKVKEHLTTIESYKNDANLSMTTAKEYLDATKLLADEVSISATTVADNMTTTKEYMDNASESSVSVKVYADKVESIKNNLEDYKTTIKELLTETKSYVHGDTETRLNEDIDNAKFYYTQMKNFVKEIEGGLVPIGTITFEELESQEATAKLGYMFNISNEFVSDDRFKDGGGKKYGAGTNVYWTDDKKWDCLAAKSLLGIKGSNEEDYRDGYVNITAENVGAYTKQEVDKSISDLGESLTTSVNSRVEGINARITSEISNVNNHISATDKRVKQLEDDYTEYNKVLTDYGTKTGQLEGKLNNHSFKYDTETKKHYLVYEDTSKEKDENGEYPKEKTELFVNKDITDNFSVDEDGTLLFHGEKIKGDSFLEITQTEYNALSNEEKNNGICYIVIDAGDTKTIRNEKVISDEGNLKSIVKSFNNKLTDIDNILKNVHSIEFIKFETIMSYILNNDLKDIAKSENISLDTLTLLSCEFIPKENMLYIFNMDKIDSQNYYNGLLDVYKQIYTDDRLSELQTELLKTSELSQKYSVGVYGFIEDRIFQLSNSFWSNPRNVDALINLTAEIQNKTCTISSNITNIKTSDTCKICIIDWKCGISDTVKDSFKSNNVTYLSAFNTIYDKVDFNYNEDSLVDICVYVKDYNIPLKAIVFNKNTDIMVDENINGIFNLEIKFAQQYTIDTYPDLTGFDIKVVITDVDKE